MVRDAQQHDGEEEKEVSEEKELSDDLFDESESEDEEGDEGLGFGDDRERDEWGE